MALFDRFKADRVACDEIVILRDFERGVPIQPELPPGSTIDPDRTVVEAAITECKLRTDLANDRFFFTADAFISKDIAVDRPGLPSVTLEYGFNITFPEAMVAGCRPSQIQPDILRRLRCQIYDIKAQEYLTLDPAAGTFDETLILTVTVKIVFEDQILIPTPTPTVSPTVAPTVTPPICVVVSTLALEIVAGKIRAQIGPSALRDQLLHSVALAIKLLKMGLVQETLVVLSALTDNLQFVFNSAPFRRQALSLILGDIAVARIEIVNAIR